MKNEEQEARRTGMVQDVQDIKDMEAAYNAQVKRGY